MSQRTGVVTQQQASGAADRGAPSQAARERLSMVEL